MKYLVFYTFLVLLITSLVSASRGDFYGKDDKREKFFRILDDHVGKIRITMDDEEWATMKKSMVLGGVAASRAEKYTTANATLEFIVEGTGYGDVFDPVTFTFQLGGSGSRSHAKPGYNIKIEEGSLFGVKSLRIRSSMRDPTLIREKLGSDMLYKMGIPTTSAAYINMEVNGEDLGIYVVTNKIKKDFMERRFDDDKVKTLYECKNAGSRFENNSVAKRCINTKEKLADDKDEITAFNDAINNATTMEEFDKILDVDFFLRTVAFEFITTAWDSFLCLGHNYFWYKRKDGKWIYILNDFDQVFGQNISSLIFSMMSGDRSYIPGGDQINVPNIALRDIDNDHKLLKYLIYDDDTRFRKIIGEIVKEVFNPKVLLPRVDELAELIRDSVANSRTIDEKTGYAKGCFNTLGTNPGWNITHFDECLGDINWNSNVGGTYSIGLKFFIEERFKYLCHTYAIDPETYELIEPRPQVSFWGVKNRFKAAFNGTDFFKDDFVRYTYPKLNKEAYKQDSYNANPEKNSEPIDYNYPLHNYEEGYTPPRRFERCWSSSLGYKCCKSCHIYSTDKYGEWGYENGQWCGIPTSCSQDKCWSITHGYPCCVSSCYPYETDEYGKWGYEGGHWCGIIDAYCD